MWIRTLHHLSRKPTLHIDYLMSVSLKKASQKHWLDVWRMIQRKGTAGRTSGALLLPRPPGLYGLQLELSRPVHQHHIDQRVVAQGCYPLDPVVLLSPISLSYPPALSLPQLRVQPVLITTSLWHPLHAIWQLNRQNGALPCSLWKQQEDLGLHGKNCAVNVL